MDGVIVSFWIGVFGYSFKAGNVSEVLEHWTGIFSQGSFLALLIILLSVYLQSLLVLIAGDTVTCRSGSLRLQFKWRIIILDCLLDVFCLYQSGFIMVIKLSEYNWSKIIRVILKSYEFPFGITSMISDQNCTTGSSLNYHFITAILKSQNSVSTNILLIK